MELIHEEGGLVEALLSERVVLEVVASVKGFDVVVHRRLAVIDIVVDVFGEFLHVGSLYDLLKFVNLVKVKFVDERDVR